MKAHKISPEIIKEVVEEVFCIDLKRRTRKMVYPAARHCFYTQCKKYTSLSLTAIGKITGHDHSTVLYSVNQYVLPDQYKEEKSRITLVLKNIYLGEGGVIIDTTMLIHHLINKNYNNITLRKEIERLKKNLLPTNEEQELIEVFRKLNWTRKSQLINQATTKLNIQKKYEAA